MKFGNQHFYERCYHNLNFIRIWNLGLALGMTLKLYTNVTKWLKLKVRKFLGLIPSFVEVTGEKLVGFFFLPSPILNRVKSKFQIIHVVTCISLLLTLVTISLKCSQYIFRYLSLLFFIFLFLLHLLFLTLLITRNILQFSSNV